LETRKIPQKVDENIGRQSHLVKRVQRLKYEWTDLKKKKKSPQPPPPKKKKDRKETCSVYLVFSSYSQRLGNLR
jgi:hypothetical protein